MPERKTFVLTIGRSYYPWVLGFCLFTVVCIIVSGIYWGSARQEAKDKKEVAEAKAALKDQAIAYEKRLGEQSARYAQEANTFVMALTGLGRAVDTMQKQNRQAAIERRDALKQAVASAKSAAAEARSAKERIAELTRQSAQTQATAVIAASAASKAASAVVQTQKTLENATLPQAITTPSKGRNK